MHEEPRAYILAKLGAYENKSLGEGCSLHARSRISSLPLGLFYCNAQQHRGREIQESATKNDDSLKHPLVPTSKFSSVTSVPDGLTEQQGFNTNNPDVLPGKEAKLRRKGVERVPLGRLSDFYFLLCAKRGFNISRKPPRPWIQPPLGR